MGKRGSSSGSTKRSKRERGPRHDTLAFQRRIDRHHGGPPAHIVAKQQLENAKRQERHRAVAAAAGAAPAPASKIVVSEIVVSEIVVPVAVAAKPAPRRRPTSVPAVSGRLDPRPPEQPARATQPSRTALRQLAASLLMIPFVAAAVALVTPASPPAPGITLPSRIADAPPMSTRAIERRIAEMTLPVTLAHPGPALPGSIRFAALRLPADVPEIPVVVPPRLELPSIDLPRLVLAPPPVVGPVEPPTASPTAPIEVAAVPPMADDRQCRAAPVQSVAIETPARDAMGPALAAAALKQTTQFVVYNARYTRIAYPGGDVSSLEGVCTDVIIRAYRALGIDLQQIVHESRVGTGDTSIDHRRTETLRKFLSIHGESLPVTEFVENFQPGDIVTYYRPQNRTSTAHIAIVSDVIAPSGRPMIIHNRGLGVQLEDALFVDKITGHYRYAGPPERTVVATSRMQTSALPTRVAVLQRTTMPVRAAAKSPAAARLALRVQNVPLTPRP